VSGFTRGVGSEVNITGTLTNTGSTFTLNAATCSWNLLGGTINNGTLNQAGGSVLALTPNGGTLSDVTISGGDLLLNTSSANVLRSEERRVGEERRGQRASLRKTTRYRLKDEVSAQGAGTGPRSM